MRKLIPIITLCIAAAALAIALIAIIAVSVAAAVPPAMLVAAPAAILGAFVAALLTPFAFWFRKDILCRIAFFIDCAAFAISAIAIIVWIAI